MARSRASSFRPIESYLKETGMKEAEFAWAMAKTEAEEITSQRGGSDVLIRCMPSYMTRTDLFLHNRRYQMIALSVCTIQHNKLNIAQLQ